MPLKDTLEDALDRQEKALIMARHFAYVQDAEKKAWVIDQMVRALCGDQYDAWVKVYNDNVPTDPWDTGKAP